MIYGLFVYVKTLSRDALLSIRLIKYSTKKKSLGIQRLLLAFLWVLLI